MERTNTSGANALSIQRFEHPWLRGTAESIVFGSATIAEVRQYHNAMRLATGLIFLHAMLAQAIDPLLRIQDSLTRGDLASARRELDKAFSATPNDPILFNFLGVLNAQQGDFSQSEQAFRKACESSPPLLQACLNLGRNYRENRANDPDALRKALKVYRDILRAVPDHVEAGFELASVLQQQGEYQLSEQQLTRLPPAVRVRPQTLALHCANEAALNHAQAARKEAGLLLASPDLAESDVLAMLPALQKTGHTRLTGELLAGLRQRGLAGPMALRALALLEESEGRFAEARATMEAAFEKAPSDAGVLLDLARIAQRKEDLKGALGYLAHAREIDPFNATVHFVFGMLSIEMDLPIEAEKSLSRAVELDDRNAYHHYALAAVMAGAGKWNDALPHFEKYCQLAPDEPRGRLALASAYFHVDNIAAATRLLEDLVDQPATSTGAHYFLGLIWAQREDYRRAADELTRAALSGKADANVFAELASARVQLGEYAAARRALDRSLAISPDGYRGNLVLLNLYQRTGDSRLKEQVKRIQTLQDRRAETAKQLLRTIEAIPR